MDVLFADSPTIGVMITLAPARPDTLAVIVVVDDEEQTEEILYLPLATLRSFLEALRAKS